MRIYNIFLCPKCDHFEYRQPEVFGREKKGPGRLMCKAGKNPEEVKLDYRTADPLTSPPPSCPDYELEARKAAK